MIISRKWVAAAASLTLFAVLTTACGGGSAKPAAGGTSSPQSGAAGSAESNIDTASKEIDVYTALEDDQIKAYLESFKKRYPDIKVNITRDSTGVLTAKLLAEKTNTKADVVWGTAATSLLVLEQNGMLEPYAPAGIERVLPEFKSEKTPATWVGIDAWETAFVVNKTEMEKRNLPIPRSYEDLAKPEYKGLITMPHPASSGTGYLSVSAFLQLMGKDQGWSYMDKLHENIALYVHSGSKPAKLAATGEYPIGISFGYRGIQEMQKGAPVEVVFPTEGSGWDLEANALMKKGKIKAAAQTFLDWAISDEAMQAYNKNYAILSIKQDNAKIPDGYTTDPMKQLIKNDLHQSAKDREAVLADWEKRYASKSEPKT